MRGVIIPTKFDFKNAFVLLFAMLWATGQMGQIFGAPAKIFFLDGLVLLTALLWIVAGKRKIKNEGLAVIGLIGALVLSFLVNIGGHGQSQIVVALMYLLRASSIMLLYFGAQSFDKKIIARGIDAALAVYLMSALFMYLLFPDTRVIKLLGYDDHYYRAIGTILDPNLSAVVYIWAFYWFSHQNKRWMIWLQVLAVGLLALSFSRSGYLAFAVSIFVLIAFQRNFKKIVWIGALALFVFLAPKPFGEGVNLTRSYSAQSRIENTKENISLPLGDTVFGKGYNFITGGNAKYTNRSSGVDNSYLYIWMTSGLVGIAAFLYLVKSSFRLIASQPWTVGAYSALTIHSIFNNSLFQLQIMVLIFVSLGYLRRVTNDK